MTLSTVVAMRRLTIAVVVFFAHSSVAWAGQQPIAFVPAQPLESFAASTVGADVLAGEFHGAVIRAHYCGPTATGGADFIVVASNSEPPSVTSCTRTAVNLVSEGRGRPYVALRVTLQWSDLKLTGSTTECASTNMPDSTCARIRSRRPQYSTDGIKADASGRSVALAVAVEFLKSGAVLHLLTGRSGEATFPNFGIPPSNQTLVTFPYAWLNADVLTGAYPLRADEASSLLEVKDSMVVESIRNITYSAHVCPAGMHDVYNLTASLASDSLLVLDVDVQPNLSACPSGNAPSLCNFQNTERSLTAQLAKQRLTRFVGHYFRPTFDHVPINISWNNKTYRLFGNVTGGVSSDGSVTFSVDWSLAPQVSP